MDDQMKDLGKTWGGMYLAWSYESKAGEISWTERRQLKLIRPDFWKDLLGVLHVLVRNKLLVPARFVFRLEKGSSTILVPEEMRLDPQQTVGFLQACMDGEYFESIVEAEGETALFSDGELQPALATHALKITEFSALSSRLSFLLTPWPFVPLYPVGSLEYELRGDGWHRNAAGLKTTLLQLQHALPGWEVYPNAADLVVDDIFVQDETGIFVHPNVLDIADALGDPHIDRMEQQALALLAKRV
jgi:hypothetical protein